MKNAELEILYNKTTNIRLFLNVKQLKRARYVFIILHFFIKPKCLHLLANGIFVNCVLLRLILRFGEVTHLMIVSFERK